MVSGATLRVVFFGTPEFAVPTLEALLRSAHQVVGVVTREDRPRGRGQRTTDMPVKARALAADIPVLQPERINDSGFLAAFAACRPDLGVVAAYGKILTESILAIPRLGMINVHGSLLPRYRGAAPVHRAVVNGERETGVTIMRVVKALDAGPMLATVLRPIGPDDTSEAVERDLARLGAPLLVTIVDALASGPVPEVPQDEASATYAHRLSRADGAVDWNRPAPAVHNLIRGLYPWPHAFTYHHGRRLILLRSGVGAGVEGSIAAGCEGDRLAHASPPAPAPRSDRLATSPPLLPGTILEASGDRLWVATGDGILTIAELQGEGRRPMPTRAFLAGSPLSPGDILTSGS